MIGPTTEYAQNHAVAGKGESMKGSFAGLSQILLHKCRNVKC